MTSKKNILIILIIVLVAGISLAAYFLYKQNVEFQSVNCFDYYKFGDNFFTNVVPEKESYTAGDNVTFFYTVTNPTNMPLTDAAVRVQVLYAGKNLDRQEGDDMIDELFVVKNVNLNPGDSYSGEFDWQIPKDINSGTYLANFYLSSEDKFNMAGLGFIPNVIGAGTKFDVISDGKNLMRFDRNSTYINNEQYKIRALPPTFSPGDEVTVKTQLINEGDAKNVTILYQVFNFDDLNPSAEVKSYTKTETVTLKDNSSLPITYDLKNLGTNAYLVKLTAIGENQKSILNLRIPVLGNQGRILYLGMDKFPMTPGKTSIIFCLTNVGVNPGDEINALKGNIKIELLDKNNVKIFEGMKKVIVDGSVTGYKGSFNIDNSYSYAVLKATLYDENGTHDLMTVVYDYSKFWNITRLFDVEIQNPNVNTGNDLKFVVSFKDNFGNSLEGNVFSYISDSSGKVMTAIQEKSFKGSTEISVPANFPPGKYKLTVIEKEFEKTISKEFNVA
jgi:hypothetical protein